MTRKEYQDNKIAHADFKPYTRWDVMKHYRETIHDDDLKEIAKDIDRLESEVHTTREAIISSKKIYRTRNLPNQQNTPQKPNK